MTQYLKASTASQVFRIGPLMTTAGAAATGLTIANTDIKLLKKGATSLVNKNSGGATELSQGVYYCTMDATDSNTLGDGDVHISVAGMMPWSGRFEVLTALNYDSLHGAVQDSFLRTHPGNFNAATGAFYKADGSTTQFTETVGTTPGADPVTSLT